MNNEIYLLSCLPLQNESLYLCAMERVSPHRRSLTESLRNEEDRRLSLGAGLLIEHVRQRHPVLPEISYQEDGKPVFEGVSFFVSISHSRDYAMLGLSPKPIGVDLECCYDDFEMIPSHFFQEAEKARLDAAKDRRAEFFELWSRKEAYIKCYHPADIRTFSVLEPKDGMEYLSFPLEGYSCVAYADRSLDTEFKQIDISDCL